MQWLALRKMRVGSIGEGTGKRKSVELVAIPVGRKKVGEELKTMTRTWASPDGQNLIHYVFNCDPQLWAKI